MAMSTHFMNIYRDLCRDREPIFREFMKTETLILNGKRLTLSHARVTAAGIALFAIMGLSACASVDPTDPSHFVDVQVVNDTASPVELIQCDTSCSTLHDRQRLEAWASTTVNVSNEGIEVGYLIQTLRGKELGCMYMSYDHVKQPAPLAISSMGRCR